MPKIKQLSVHEAQKIAAGQVIERPANIVKELIENALDACATTITVFIEDAGKKLIRVVDNGYGMDRDDAQLCFEKHATSKLTQLHELTSLSTFGFRGEAMPSIAAVCKVTLITRQADTHEGTQICIEENSIRSIDTVAAPVGTDITARDLFYTVPVRKKFLKQRDTELRQITHLFHAFCFSYPTVHFKLVSESKELFNCPAVTDTIDRCTQIWQHETMHNMLPLNSNAHNGTVILAGAISNHHYFKYDRTSIFLFINNRWIKDYKLTNAFIKGYMNVAPAHQYPMGFISITVDPATIDINIHPRKEEVQFLHPRTIEHAIQAAIKEHLEAHLSTQLKRSVTLAQHDRVQPFSSSLIHVPYTPTAYRSSTQVTLPTTIHHRLHTHAFDTEPLDQSIVSSSAPVYTPNIMQENLPPSSDCQVNSTIIPLEVPRIIGQYNNTYILLEHTDGIFIIDQHAAHERILYEKFGNRFDTPLCVQLLFPVIIQLSQDDMVLMNTYLAVFKQTGLNIEQISAHQIQIDAVPVHVKNVSLESVIRETICWIKESHTLDTELLQQSLNEQLRAQMACKAAIKAGDVLSMDHIHQLIKDLYATDNRITCPHGRPTGWLLGGYEIEKKFKRKT